MHAEMIELLLTLSSVWMVLAVAGLGIIVLPWTSSETAASASALVAVADVACASAGTVEDCLSRRIVVG
jgi:hypothetical protein